MPATVAARPKLKTPKPANTRKIGTKTSATKNSATKASHAKTSDMLAMAESHGVLSGTRTRVIRGRMPAALVAEAKRRTGITSDSKLLEAALATVAYEDDYWAWMMQHRGTISKDIDLEL